MGLFDKIKGAVNAVTGGAAKVTIEFSPAAVDVGGSIMVKISATSTGQDVKSGGIFVDLWGEERIKLKSGAAPNISGDATVSKTTIEKAIQIAPALTIAANETKLFEGQVQIPADFQPTYNGAYTQHVWQIRGRVDATGNDPDSGWKPVTIGRKAT